MPFKTYTLAYLITESAWLALLIEKVPNNIKKKFPGEELSSQALGTGYMDFAHQQNTAQVSRALTLSLTC